MGWLPVILAGTAIAACLYWVHAVRRDARTPTVRDLRPMWASDASRAEAEARLS